jgi:hypothetical protein
LYQDCNKDIFPHLHSQRNINYKCQISRKTLKSNYGRYGKRCAGQPGSKLYYGQNSLGINYEGLLVIRRLDKCVDIF